VHIETPILSRELPNLAIHGSHNAAVVLEYQGHILEIIEFERLLDSKNIGYCQYMAASSRRYIASIILDYIKDKYGFDSFDTVLHQHCDSNDDTFTKTVELFHYNLLFPAHNYIPMSHHAAHAAGSFYQSDFNSAIVFSFDGGGNDGWFNVYLCDRKNGIHLLDKKDQYDLGFAYMSFGEFLKDIRLEPALSIGNLVYSGKILGYQSYGNVVTEWYDAIKEYYLAKPNGSNYTDLLKTVSDKTGLTFDIDNRLEGEVAQNLAATSQKVFEDVFFEIIDPYVKEYPYPICISGGCALNIVLNTKVKERYELPVFIGPNPNDCGIATGMMLQCLRPQSAYDTSYLGIEILDKNMLPRYIEHNRGEKVHISYIIDELIDGKIMGVVQGRSEHGPRALGNRSIICSPINPDMKDILNKKVKDREWYRPFAPIVRLEDVSEYFDWEGPSEFMSFCPKVKEKYRDTLPSITHVDGTARVQTITRDKNEFIYDLLTLFKEKTGVGVLINTSFNVNGKPILSSYADAFEVYNRTEMDCLYLDGWYFRK